LSGVNLAEPVQNISQYWTSATAMDLFHTSDLVT